MAVHVQLVVEDSTSEPNEAFVASDSAVEVVAGFVPELEERSLAGRVALGHQFAGVFRSGEFIAGCGPERVGLVGGEQARDDDVSGVGVLRQLVIGEHGASKELSRTGH